MIKILTIIFISFFLFSCNGSKSPETQEKSNSSTIINSQIPSFTPTEKQIITPIATEEIVTNPTVTTKPFNNIIECSEAQVGDNLTCKISQAFCSYKPNIEGSPTYCNDAPYPNHGFTLLVWGRDWSKFDGKCLVITGNIYFYEGKPQIKATSESQVEFCN